MVLLRLVPSLPVKKYSYSSTLDINITHSTFQNHSRLASIASRSHGGNNCPYCGSRKLNSENNLAAIFPLLIWEWNYIKNDYSPHDYFSSSHFYVWWSCLKCNHEWQASITNRTSKKSGCPSCAIKKNKTYRISYYEN